MRLETRLTQSLQTTIHLAPQMIQAIEILQLPNIDLKDRIDLEIAENEVLEVDDQSPTLDGAGPPTRAEGDTGEAPDEGAEPGDGEFSETVDRLTRMVEEDRAFGLHRGRAEGQEASDRKQEALQATPAPPPTVQDRLAEQLSLVEAGEPERTLARAIVYSLDREGLLPVNPLARPVLEALARPGGDSIPVDDVVPGLTSPARDDGPLVEDGDDAAAGRRAVPDYGAYGDFTLSMPSRHRLVPRPADPERAATQRADRAREREQGREDLRREAEGVRAAALRLRDRLARDGRTADLDEQVLLYPLSEILDLLQREGLEAGLADAERALGLVQSLEPRGVAGRSAEETLLLQLRPGDPLRERKAHLIRHHLEDWRRNRLPRIAQGMGIAMAEVQELLEEMGDLRSRPGAVLQTERSAYVHPDVVVEWTQEEYEVRLVNEYFPTLRISPLYLRMFDDASTDPALREMLKKKIGSARWLIDAVRQRQDTLLRVVRAIVRHQGEFLDRGLAHMKPLKMQRIADELGIHVSTVSRAISDKYAQTPQGILPLKFFFHGATRSSDGSVESRLTMKDRVRQAIEAEDRRNPLSDEELAKRFQAEGVDIARRTVTKYRKQLSLPSSRERKEWA